MKEKFRIKPLGNNSACVLVPAKTLKDMKKVIGDDIWITIHDDPIKDRELKELLYRVPTKVDKDIYYSNRNKTVKELMKICGTTKQETEEYLQNINELEFERWYLENMSMVTMTNQEKLRVTKFLEDL